jgi:hypothetical protein
MIVIIDSIGNYGNGSVLVKISYRLYRNFKIFATSLRIVGSIVSLASR